MSLFSLVTSFQLRGKGNRERQRIIINIHSMVKCVQLVGRLRDRATALFGGKVRIRIVVATSPPDLWISGYVFVTMGHNVPFSRVAVLASFVSSVVCP